jgi:hypothetical protein
MIPRTAVIASLGALCLLLACVPARAQNAPAREMSGRTDDRDGGLPLSMLGSYIKPGQLIVYPFYEYYRNKDQEYKPSELGFADERDFRGRFRASEGLIYAAYGVSENVAVEIEAAMITAWQERATDDTSGLPPRLKQSGIGDVEGQIRWRYNRESASRPEYFSYFEAVAPIQTKKLLIGTPDWELKFGSGLIRGLSWGTVTVRAAVGYSAGAAELGEYAVEYLRRVNRRLRIVGALEGTQDEIGLIAEAQVFLSPRAYLKLNNAFGVSSKAPEFAPEIGLMIVFP